MAKAPSDLTPGSLAEAMFYAKHTYSSLADEVSKALGRTVSVAALKLGTGPETSETRPVALDVAEAVQELTRSEHLPDGFEASAANWPRLKEPYDVTWN